MEILLHNVYKPYLRLPNLSYFFCCVKFFLLRLVSFIANYDCNNENIVP